MVSILCTQYFVGLSGLVPKTESEACAAAPQMRTAAAGVRMNALVRFTKLQGRVPSWLCAARKASHAGPALCFVLSRHVHLHSAIDRTSQFLTLPERILPAYLACC